MILPGSAFIFSSILVFDVIVVILPGSALIFSRILVFDVISVVIDVL